MRSPVLMGCDDGGMEQIRGFSFSCGIPMSRNPSTSFLWGVNGTLFLAPVTESRFWSGPRVHITRSSNSYSLT